MRVRLLYVEPCKSRYGLNIFYVISHEKGLGLATMVRVGILILWSSLTLICTWFAAYLRRGCGYNGVKKYKEAKKDLDRVLQAEPKNKKAKVGKMSGKKAKTKQIQVHN